MEYHDFCYIAKRIENGFSLMKRVLFSSQKTGISIDPIHPLPCLWKGRQAGQLDRSSSPSKKQRTKLGKGRFLLQLPAPSRPATMHKLGRGNKVKLQQFMSVTGVSEKAALAILHGRDWNMDGAFEFFYNQPPSRSKTDPRRLEDLYMRYKDPFSDMISVDGITLFCEDLKVDPGDIVTLVISWHMKAATMCEFSRQEFIGGLLSLGVDSIDKLKSLLPTLRTELKDEHKFKEIYNFAFTWAKEKGQKSLALDTALGMWRLMFAERPWPLVEHWCNFLQTKHNKAISKDTWSQLFEFSRIDPSLSNYDAEGAWPYLIDEFVEYLNEKGLRVL